MKNFIFISPHFPSSYWRFCKALKERGFNVLGIGDALHSELPKELLENITEYYCCDKMEIYENEKKAVEYYEKKYGPISFIESNNEFWLEKDARLRTDFNVKTGLQVKDIKKYKLKSEMKKYYKKAGLKCARFILISTYEKAIEFAKEVNFPIFIKPNNGVGAQGTFKIKNEEDLKHFFLVKEKDVEYICEEFVDGRIISFDGVTNSKSEPIFYTGHVFMQDNAEIVLNNLDDMYFCIPTDALDDVLVEAGTKTLKAFGVKNRFFHLEFFALKEDHPYLGKKGTIVPLEVNMRPAGAYTPDLINFANSVNCYNIYADSIAFDENRENMDYDKFYACAISRRLDAKYLNSFDDILNKYKNNVTYYGEYPEVLRDDMGDLFVFAKFTSLEEVFEYDKFCRTRI